MKTLFISAVLLLGSCKAIDAIAGDEQKSEQVSSAVGNTVEEVADIFDPTGLLAAALGSAATLLTQKGLAARRKKTTAAA